MWITCYYLRNKRKKRLCQTAIYPVRTQSLRTELLSLIYKRLAICTFLLGWVHLMSSDLDGFKGAVILGLCIVSTILDGTFDALIFSVYFHGKASFLIELDSGILFAEKQKKYP